MVPAVLDNNPVFVRVRRCRGRLDSGRLFSTENGGRTKTTCITVKRIKGVKNVRYTKINNVNVKDETMNTRKDILQ